MSLFAQFATILGVLSLILLVCLINVIMNRKAAVDRLISERNLANARGGEEFQALLRVLPEWLAYKVKDTQYELVLGRMATWLDYARGSLLLATVGTVVAFMGALLASSQLLLFGVVGAGMIVVGLQIAYAAAQDAGVFNSSARHIDDRKKAVSAVEEPSGKTTANL